MRGWWGKVRFGERIMEGWARTARDLVLFSAVKITGTHKTGFFKAERHGRTAVFAETRFKYCGISLQGRFGGEKCDLFASYTNTRALNFIMHHTTASGTKKISPFCSIPFSPSETPRHEREKLI
jgi:hypothetical protein